MTSIKYKLLLYVHASVVVDAAVITVFDVFVLVLMLLELMLMFKFSFMLILVMMLMLGPLYLWQFRKDILTQNQFLLEIYQSQGLCTLRPFFWENGAKWPGLDAIVNTDSRFSHFAPYFDSIFSYLWIENNNNGKIFFLRSTICERDTKMEDARWSFDA